MDVACRPAVIDDRAAEADTDGIALPLLLGETLVGIADEGTAVDGTAAVADDDGAPADGPVVVEGGVRLGAGFDVTVARGLGVGLDDGGTVGVVDVFGASTSPITRVAAK